MALCVASRYMYLYRTCLVQLYSARPFTLRESCRVQLLPLSSSHLHKTLSSFDVTKPDNLSTDEVTTQHDKDDSKSRSRSRLHKRDPTEQQTASNMEWSQFRRDLAQDDSFGTISQPADDKDNKYDDTRRKSRMPRKKSGKQKNSAYSKLRKDPEWVETFGSLEPDDPDLKDFEIESQSYKDDEGEGDSAEQPYRRLAVEGRRNTPNWYGRQIERLAKEGKIYECVNVLETTMLKEDRVMPNQYVFTVLIGALGRIGYTKKAFSLYNKMKKFGLQPEDPTYTALFNACSNSPWTDDGLKRAQYLMESLNNCGFTPNLSTYKAMIKAFGRCGDIQTAFALVDKLNAGGLRADEEVFSMLLQSCASHQGAGLRYAIEVWRKMAKRRKVQHSIYHYNLLLRIIRDCGIGDPELANQLLISRSHDQQSISPGEQTNKQTAEKSENRTPRITLQPVMDNHSTTENADSESSRNIASVQQLPSQSWWDYEPRYSSDLIKSETSTDISQLHSELPNILNPHANFDDVIGLGELDTAEKRASLFGGLPGILKSMGDSGVSPDIKTFTHLLDLVPSSREAERDLMAAITAYNVETDVDFLNLVIRRRNLRKDYSGAKDVLVVISQRGLQPNNMTYGCLAMGCWRREDGLQLLSDMEKADLMPSVDVCNILIYQSYLNFRYKKDICEAMKRLGIAPNKAVLTRIEQTIGKARNLIVRQEKGLAVPGYAKADSFSEDFGTFMKYYNGWLQTVDLDKDVHPWDSLRKPTPSQDTPGT